jgi:hypothetical protein
MNDKIIVALREELKKAEKESLKLKSVLAMLNGASKTIQNGHKRSAATIAKMKASAKKRWAKEKKASPKVLSQ